MWRIVDSDGSVTEPCPGTMEKAKGVVKREAPCEHCGRRVRVITLTGGAFLRPHNRTTKSAR
jgi:hypothetical protein